MLGVFTLFSCNFEVGVGGGSTNFRSLSGAMAVFFEEPGEDFFGLYSKKIFLRVFISHVHVSNFDLQCPTTVDAKGHLQCICLQLCMLLQK